MDLSGVRIKPLRRFVDRFNEEQINEEKDEVLAYITHRDILENHFIDYIKNKIYIEKEKLGDKFIKF